jgi:hypothetical protein
MFKLQLKPRVAWCTADAHLVPTSIEHQEKVQNIDVTAGIATSTSELYKDRLERCRQNYQHSQASTNSFKRIQHAITCLSHRSCGSHRVRARRHPQCQSSLELLRWSPERYWIMVPCLCWPRFDKRQELVCVHVLQQRSCLCCGKYQSFSRSLG